MNDFFVGIDEKTKWYKDPNMSTFGRKSTNYLGYHAY